ncbi:MAG TPA: DUF4268 domain-containing protein, partial [Phycisphaerae bacterium]|nr:DUF4268 domain-containing protein [Phycisphaerae bacterium]
MTTPELGRLNQVEPRTVWPSEASDFTPWLSLPDNLMLLGEALGIDLEIESSEQSVGPFRADLVCRESISDRRILIENQIERTDHTHLGQLMTYAAGLDAVTIVWIARRFTEEHRAALDWLNDITDEGFSFFGVEIELWRIGNSAVAPHFKVISKPNEWSRSVKRDAKKAELEELSETRRLYHDYWTAFSEYLGRVPSQIKLNKPPTGMWTVHSIGHGNRFQLSIRIGLRKREAEVLFVIREPARLAKYRWFLERKDDIERELGTGLEWRELPNGKESHVRRVFSDMDPSARA